MNETYSTTDFFDTIIISIGKNCPHKCSFCLHEGNEKGFQSTKELDILERFFSSLETVPSEIILSGNDPLVYSRFSSQVISLIKRKFQNQTKIRILSNLLTFSRYLNRESIDIPQGVSLGITIDPRVPLIKDWSLPKYLENVKIENAMFTFSLSTESTSSEFVIKWAQNLNVDTIRINIDFFSDDKIKDARSLSLKIVKLIKEAANRGLYVLGDWDSIFGRVIEKRSGDYCGGGGAYLTPAGIAPCAFFKKDSVPYELLFENKTTLLLEYFSNIMSSKRVENIRAMQCNKCYLEKRCNGGCLAVDGVLFCSFMRFMGKILETDKDFRELYLPKGSGITFI